MSEIDPALAAALERLAQAIRDDDDPPCCTVSEWLAASRSADRLERLRAITTVSFETKAARIMRGWEGVECRLLELLTDPDPGVAAVAALCFTHWSVPAALPILLDLVPRVSDRHRAQLYLALSGQDHPDAHACLVRASAGDGEDSAWAKTALRWEAERKAGRDEAG